jgi:hypothetical protein
MIRHAIAVVLVGLSLAACGGPRIYVATGTTIGLKATPGDGATRPPGVVLGYKRAEVALVPTKGAGASETADSASAVAGLRFETKWFGHTELDSFIATGFAAAPLMKPASPFSEAFAKATVGVLPTELVERQGKLVALLPAMSEMEAQQILDRLMLPAKRGKTAVFSLQDYIASADTDAALERLESAFFRRR